MSQKFYDQNNDPAPTELHPFFTGEAPEKDTRLSMADAVAIVGVMAVLFAPFTIALAYWVVTR